MDKKILNRILRKAGSDDLLKALTKRLSLPDLQSLLLEVYKQKTSKLDPVYISRQYDQNRNVAYSPINPARFLAFDQLAFSLLPSGFEALELSPVEPLGANSIIARLIRMQLLWHFSIK